MGVSNILGLGTKAYVGTPPDIIPPMPRLTPTSAWNGTAGTGFGGSNPAAPTDPTRSTAKPALRLIVPPRQRFTNKLVVGVAAAANNGGTLIGGVQTVRFHFEGAVQEVAPRFHTFTDVNGVSRTYWGYWAVLRKPAGVAGEARFYAEAVPGNLAMQSRVIGPFSFFPAATAYDLELTINPDVAATGNNYHTMQTAMDRIRTSIPVPTHPRITINKALTNFTLANTIAFSVSGYITIEASQPVTFGFATLDTSASVDTNNAQRSRGGPLWLRGGNLTFDFALMDGLIAETALSHQWVLEGVTFTNSAGIGALFRGGNNTQGQRVTGNPWFLECAIANVRNGPINASLARGNLLQNVSADIFSGGSCIVGNRVERHSDVPTNDDAPALSVVYNGVEATATVARAGGLDLNTAVYTFKWGINSRTFTCGKLATFYATGLSGDQGYTFAHLVTWVNTVLAGLDAGWSATVGTASARRASSGSLAGLKGQGFGDTSCKTTARQIVSNFDIHGDWYQQFSATLENVIAYDNIGYDMQTQNIFLSPVGGTFSRDAVFYNNALGNDTTGSVYFDETVVVSQLGRNNTAVALSHVVVAHNSMPNQGLQFRNGGTSFSTTDAYCLVANNALRTLVKEVTTAGREPGAIIRNNHIHAGQTPLPEAVGTTIGGDKNSLFVSFNTGNFTPAGALLTNLKAPVFTTDLNRAKRAATDAVGAIKVAA